MGKLIRSPTCNKFLSTRDVSYVYPFLFFAQRENLGTRLQKKGCKKCKTKQIQHHNITNSTHINTKYVFSSVLWLSQCIAMFVGKSNPANVGLRVFLAMAAIFLCS